MYTYIHDLPMLEIIMSRINLGYPPMLNSMPIPPWLLAAMTLECEAF